jgi:hypothetical protein
VAEYFGGLSGPRVFASPNSGQSRVTDAFPVTLSASSKMNGASIARPNTAHDTSNIVANTATSVRRGDGGGNL